MQDVGTVTLELDLSISRNSLDLFLQRLLWEKMAKDKRGNTSNVIRFKVNSRLEHCWCSWFCLKNKFQLLLLLSVLLLKRHFIK